MEKACMIGRIEFEVSGQGLGVVFRHRRILASLQPRVRIEISSGAHVFNTIGEIPWEDQKIYFSEHLQYFHEPVQLWRWKFGDIKFLIFGETKKWILLEMWRSLFFIFLHYWYWIEIFPISYAVLYCSSEIFYIQVSNIAAKYVSFPVRVCTNKNYFIAFPTLQGFIGSGQLTYRMA